jgi:hypothetical protein
LRKLSLFKKVTRDYDLLSTRIQPHARVPRSHASTQLESFRISTERLQRCVLIPWTQLDHVPTEKAVIPIASSEPCRAVRGNVVFHRAFFCQSAAHNLFDKTVMQIDARAEYSHVPWTSTGNAKNQYARFSIITAPLELLPQLQNSLSRCLFECG